MLDGDVLEQIGKKRKNLLERESTLVRKSLRKCVVTAECGVSVNTNRIVRPKTCYNLLHGLLR